MDCEYAHPYYTKASSPMKPRFLTRGRDIHNGEDVRAAVSTMCENLLEGESNRLEEQQRRNKTPRDLDYDRGLRCDGGYTMYTPVYTGPDGNISQCAKAYNAECQVNELKRLHSFADWPKSKCPCRLSRGRCPKVSGDGAAITCQHVYGQSFHPYEARARDTAGVEQEPMSYSDYPLQWKSARRKKRHDKKMNKKKPAYPRECTQKFAQEENLNDEWRRLMLANQSNASNVDAEVGWEVNDSTTPPLAKSHKDLLQEILDLKARSEGKRNRELESNVSLSNSGQGERCQNWKAPKLSRNALYEKTNGAGHERDETESTSFSDGRGHKNFGKKTTASAWEEMPKTPYRNLVRTSANADWLRGVQTPENGDAMAEIETGNLQYSNYMRYPARGISKYNSHCNAIGDGRTANKVNCRSQVQDVAREPWKCTVWDDRTISTVSQELTWTCEMYSQTSLCEPDVGMAFNDHYRSYIDARNHKKATNDFGCQNNLRDHRSLINVSSAVTQTEGDCFETAAIHSQAAQLSGKDKLCGNLTGQDAVPKPKEPGKPSHFNSPKINKNEQKQVKSDSTLSNQKQNKTAMVANEITANGGNNRSSIENLKLTSITPPVYSSKVDYLLKPRVEPINNTSDISLNVLARSESKNLAIHALVGKALNEGISQVSKITDEHVNGNVLSNAQRPVKEATGQEDPWPKEKENTIAFTDGQGEGNVVISKAIQDVINKAYEKISPYEDDLGEHSIKWCSRQVCAHTESSSETALENKSIGKRTNQQSLRGDANKLKDKMKTQMEMQAYERYKEGRKKYEEELAQKGCEFEIEELKFQKQVSYDSEEKQSKGESFQNIIVDSLNIPQLERIRLLDETVQLVDSSGSVMDSPLTTANQSENEAIRTDESFSYQEKCYKKGTPPPGDRYDMVPCLTCSRSSSCEPSSRSFPFKQQKSRNKSLGRKRKEEERRKSIKSVRKRNSVSPRKSSYSSSESDRTPVKRGKKPLKRYRSQGRKSARKISKDIENSSSRQVPELASRQSEMSSSRSSPSMPYDPNKRSIMSNDRNMLLEDAVSSTQSTLYSRILPPKKDTLISKSLRTEVKKQFNVTSPELLDLTSRETPRTFNKNYQSSPHSFSYGDSDSINVKQDARQRGVNNSKGDPFSSLNTAELNLSIIKLYTEIQKLQQQLELNRDESDMQSRTEKCVKASPSSDSADKTLACSSRCQSLPDNTVCNSFSATPKEMSYTADDCSSTEWVESSKISLKEEKVQKLCQLYKKQCGAPYPMEMQENGASNLMCRSDSPEKIPSRKLIPRDTSMNRSSKPLYTKLAAPCVKSWKQSNNNTRANRKQNAPSPSNGPTEQSSSSNEDDNENDESVAEDTYASTNTERRDAKAKSMTVSSNSGIEYAQARENHKNNRVAGKEKRGDAPQKVTHEPEAFPDNFTEEMQRRVASQIELPCFEDDLHLHLTSALSDRNIAGEAQCGDAFNYSVSGNDDLRSARSYVCSSSWLSSSNRQTDNGDALGNCSNFMSPDERSDAVCVKQQGQVKLLADHHAGNGNNSKLDESETLGEYSLRFENKVPTTVTCRKLKMFGASREQILRFYTSSVLNNAQSRSVWNGLSLSPPSPVAAPKVSPDESPRAEFRASEHDDLRGSANREAERDKNNAESRGPPIAKEEHGGDSRWSPRKKLIIPYTVPQRRRASGSKAKAKETSQHVVTTSCVDTDTAPSNDAVIRLDKQALATNEYDTEIGCDSKRRKCPPRYFAKPNIHHVKVESPVEKIIELLTDKPDSAVEKGKPSLASDTKIDHSSGYEERLGYRNGSQDINKRKVFQPNKTYSEFERSPQGELYSPVSLSKFFQQNVQQIAEYIHSFREIGALEKKAVDRNSTGKNSGKNYHYDKRDNWERPRKNHESGLSSNNIYGQCPTEEVTRKTYRENKYSHGMESDVLNHKPPKASRKPTNQMESVFENNHNAFTPKNSPQFGNDTLWANYSGKSDESRKEQGGTVQGLYGKSKYQLKMAHIRSEINDISSHSAQCPLYESMHSQKNNSSLTPQSADINPLCEEHSVRSRVLLNNESQTSPYLTAVTENNNSNQGGTIPNYNNVAELPSASAQTSSRLSRLDKAEFGGPEKVSYISYKKTKGQPKPGTLNKPHVHSEISTGGMDSLKTLNLVGCVKEIFFKSFKPDLSSGPREMGDHVCPPKPRPWPRSKPVVKPSDTEKTLEKANGKGNKKLEETILCEYIAGRKQKSLREEDNTRKPASETDPHAVQPNYITSQRHGTKFDSSREAKLSTAPDIPSNEAVNGPSRCHKDEYPQVIPLGVNKNPRLPCNKVKICSHEKGRNTFACTVPSQSKWKGDQYNMGTHHPVVLTADSNKAISHYSDAIKTGLWRSKGSAWPLSEAFSDFSGERDNSKNYVSVENTYTREYKASDEAQNEGRIPQEKCYVQAYPKHADVVSRGESSIISSLEKMMQNKRPCFAEHCQLHARDSNMESAKYCNNFGHGLRLPRSHPAKVADDNNSSNKIVNGEPAPLCSDMPTPTMASAYHTGLDNRVNNYTNQSGQDNSIPSTPLRNLLHVNGGTPELKNPWNNHDASKIKNSEHSGGGCGVSLLKLNLDSSEHLKNCGIQKFVLENCSRILFRGSRDEPNAVKDNSCGDGVGNDAWGNASSQGPLCDESTTSLGLDHGLVDLSLNLTQDDEDIVDNGECSADEGKAEDGRVNGDARPSSKSDDDVDGAGERVAPGAGDGEARRNESEKSDAGGGGDDGVGDAISEAGDVSDASSDSDTGSDPGPRRGDSGSAKSSRAESESCDSRGSSDSDGGSGNTSDDDR